MTRLHGLTLSEQRAATVAGSRVTGDYSLCETPRGSSVRWCVNCRWWSFGSLTRHGNAPCALPRLTTPRCTTPLQYCGGWGMR